jgi:rhodanese-related sulfurtransferase
VYELWRTLRDLGAIQIAEVDRLVDTFLADRGALDAVSMDELARRLTEDAVVVLDVRPVVEYDQGHIVGARSIPIDELERRLTELPRDQEIVAYCDEAAWLRVDGGYRARRLPDGLPVWLAAGYPVERVAAAS